MLARGIFELREAFLILGGVHFGGDDEHGLLREFFAVAGEFLEDNFEIVDGFAAAHFADVDQMEEQPGAFDVPQELDAQPVAQVCAFDEAGDVGHDEGAEVAAGLHDAEIGFEGGEGVVGDLGPRGGDAGDQGGLAGVGEADQADVGEKFQLEPQRSSSPGRPGSWPWGPGGWGWRSAGCRARRGRRGDP
jgi:hypothetical protein